MGKGNKTLEEELDEDEQNEQDLDFGLYQQGSVGGPRLLENNLERKESVLPQLNKFTSVFAPLPIRREQSFQYLVDPSLISNSINSTNFQQMGNLDNYQEQFGFEGDLEAIKDDDLKRQQSLFSLNRNESNNFYYNNNAQDDNDQDAAWIDIDEGDDNENIDEKNINNKINLNRAQSTGQQLSKYGSVVVNEENNEEEEDDEDVSQLKPEQFIQIESRSNLKSNQQMKEQLIEISADDDQEEVVEIFSEDGIEGQKKSAQSLNSIKIVDLESMEEEKRKKKIKPIRKNSNISRDFIDLEDDQEIKENYKLTHAEEFGIISNMNDWVNLSRNNMRLRLLNRKYQSELNRERNVQIKKSKNHQEIYEKMKKQLKKLITSNQQLAESNQEIDRRYKETIQQFQRVTTEFTDKQKAIQDLHCQLTNSETTHIQLKTIIQNKESEIENLKNTIKICEESAARIQQKKSLFENYDNNFNNPPIIERSKQIKEVQQKLEELSREFGEKSLGLSASDDMFQIFCVLYRKLLNLQQDNQKKDEDISKLQEFQAQKDNLELRARLAEDELELVKKNNIHLSQVLSEKENAIQSLKIQVRNVEQLNESNERLQAEVTTLQEQKFDKERLLMEQEIIHQIKIDNILDSINNPQLKSTIKKQLEELMDINQITSSQFNLQQTNPSQEPNQGNSITQERLRVKINKKKSDVSEECILLKQTLMKLFNWEIQYVGSQPIRFNLIDKKNQSKKQMSVNLQVNADGEVEIINKQYLLKSVRKLWKMLNSDIHMTSLRSCVENFWLITALQLKEYLDSEEKEFNKQMELQSQNELAQKDNGQEIEQDDNVSCSSSLSSGQSDQLEQEEDFEKKAQNMEVSQDQLTANKLQEEEEIPSDKQDNQIDEEDIQEEIENEDDDYEEDEILNDEDTNQNQNQMIQNKWENYDQQDEEDDSQLLKELQQGNFDKEEDGDESNDEQGEIQDEDGSDNIQQENDENS